MTTRVPRLVPSPVFLLSPIRSGSTLLRCLLNTHTEVHAPHELHLRYLAVQIDSEYTELAVKTLGLDIDELRHLLWDRLLHSRLCASGKRILVDKSPSNLWIHPQLRRCWPEAKFVFLRRNPADIIDSIVAADDGRDEHTATLFIEDSILALDHALAQEPGALLVRYEDLISKAEDVCRLVCDHLGVTYQSEMLEYGNTDHGPFIYGIGDWGPKIQSGRIQPPTKRPLLPRTPRIAELCRRWGYPVTTAEVHAETMGRFRDAEVP